LKKLRIIYYSPHPTHDIVSEVGYSTHQRETIAAFLQLGHEVLPVVMGGTETASVKNHIDGLTQKAGNVSGLKRFLPLFLWNALKDIRLLMHDRRAGRQLETAIHTFNPDLIYERGEYLQDSGVKMAVKHGIKHILEVNSPVVEEMAAFEGPDLFRFMGHRKERTKLRRTNMAVVVSSALGEYLRNRYQYKGDLLMIPNAINPDRDIPSAQEIAEIRNRYTSNSKIIGFVGSLFPYHGVDKLIDAFKLVLTERQDLHLLIVGDGNIRETLEEHASSLPKGTCTFAGRVPHRDVMAYIGAFDIAVMAASNWYGSPIKIFEYGRMAVPILAPNTGPVRDVMEHEKDGYLVDPDVNAIAGALINMIDQEEKWRQTGENFRRKILQKHTWTIHASTIVESAAALTLR
jgi:glycosyltransferase involved in cell wall biosynthesis